MKVSLRIKPFSNGVDISCASLSANLDSYSNIFLQSATQLQVYEVVCKDLAQKFMKGYSVTILAYGQTGSGKTHTMIGQLGTLTESHLADSNQQVPSEWGIFPRVAFDLVKLSTETIFASAVEVYFDDVFDLCNGRAVLSMKNCSGGGASRSLVPGTIPGGKDSNFAGTLLVHPSSCYCRHCYMARKGVKERKSSSVESSSSSSTFSIQGELWVPLKSEHDIARLSRLIDIERTSKGHELNSASSRSHCIISLQLRGASGQRFTLVDLAGSERIEKTKVSGLGKGQAVAINESLTTLGGVIKAIKNQSAHIPFRDSTLTKLLSHSLKGESSLMSAIVCVSGDPVHEDETSCSLKFGKEMAFKSVQVEPRVSQSSSISSEAYKSSQLEILRAKLSTLEKESFGSSATKAGIRLFQENLNLKLKLEDRVKELKVTQKETPDLVSTSEIQAIIQQRDDVRDVILRQKTIPGFYHGPSKEYTKTLLEIKELEKS